MSDQLPAVLLRRRGLVMVPALTPETTRRRRWRSVRRRDAAIGTAVLEVELIHRGYLLSAGMYQRCITMEPDRLAGFGGALLDLLDAGLGADVDHVPLFRGFPETVPDDTTELYVERMFAVLLQRPEQPCVLCGQTATVHPVKPCGHLVCQACWDGAVYSACPICHRRIDPDDPFLQRREPAQRRRTVLPPVEGLRLLAATDEPAEAAAELATALLTRQTPLSPDDRRDLAVLVDVLIPTGSLDWLPDTIGVRETRAAVVAQLLPAYPEVIGRLDTATDVLRLLYALMDADPGLRTPPARRKSLPRAVRRTVLARLDSFAPPRLVEDMLRHREAWKAIGENLHPFEFARRYPVAATAFAVLRGTDLVGRGRAEQPIREVAARYPQLRLEQGRLRTFTHAGQVESAFATGRPTDALDLLVYRPGELLRRVLQLARTLPPAHHPELLDSVADAVPDVSPAVLVAVLGQLRTPPDTTRLFFPRGGSARAWSEPGERPPLPAMLAAELADTLVRELVRRAGGLPPIGRAFLDERLAELVAPGSDRSASAALVRLTRGSTQPVPAGQRLRVFLHWQQPDDLRVDLDLAVAVFDEHWDYLGQCDYTTLRLENDVLVHSGDLTSAPAPLGASEFVDLDTEGAELIGGRFLVPVVFSYNDVPFDRLVHGFAGVMRKPAELFEPRAVAQRFDLDGPAKVLLPFAVDLWSRRLRWYDVNLSAAGFGHNLERYWVQLSYLGSAMEDVYDAGDRVSLWELCCWQAAGRAGEVVVRCADGSVIGYRRRDGESAVEFARRLARRAEPDVRLDAEAAAGADLVAVVTGDVEPAPGAEVYALHPATLDANRVELVDAAHLLAALAPDTRARLPQ